MHEGDTASVKVLAFVGVDGRQRSLWGGRTGGQVRAGDPVGPTRPTGPAATPEQIKPAADI